MRSYKYYFQATYETPECCPLVTEDGGAITISEG